MMEVKIRVAVSVQVQAHIHVGSDVEVMRLRSCMVERAMNEWARSGIYVERNASVLMLNLKLHFYKVSHI